MSVKFWPKRRDIRPQAFLLYGIGYWLEGVVLSFVVVGYTLYTSITPDGRYVKIYNCTETESEAGKSCTYQTAGKYFQQTIHDDAWIGGFIVGVIVLVSYGHHLLIWYAHKKYDEDKE